MDILLRNKNRKDQGQYQCFFDLERTETIKVNVSAFLTLREQKRMYSSEMKENERTKEKHI
jgi:hypothetical protein